MPLIMDNIFGKVHPFKHGAGSVIKMRLPTRELAKIQARPVAWEYTSKGVQKNIQHLMIDVAIAMTTAAIHHLAAEFRETAIWATELPAIWHQSYALTFRDPVSAH